METPVADSAAQSRLLRPAWVMLSAAALLPFTYLPPIDPFKTPNVDLTGPVAVSAYWIAESGGARGIPFVGLFLTILVVGLAGSWKERAVTALVIIAVWGAMLGTLAYANEHFVKPAFGVPRPCIVALASTPADAPILKKTAAEFYALPDKKARSEYLTTVLPADMAMQECVRAHWIVETGYSFPSGHAFAAMLTATLFVGLGLSRVDGSGRWLFLLPALWAVAVCYSRPILRVHSPTDVCVGAVEGMLAGWLALLIVGRLAPGVARQNA